MKRLLTLLLLTTALALAVAAPAHAAEETPTVTPVVIDVQLWPEDVPGSTSLVVVAVLPTDTPFPARVTLPVPKGTQLTWVGEIFPANDQEDIPRQPEVPADDKVTITVEKSRYVQYEGQYRPYRDSGGRRRATIDWVQTAPAGALQFAFKLPITAEQVKTEPAYEGSPDTNERGEKLYTLPDRKLAVGESLEVSIEYEPSQAQDGQGVPGGTDIVLYVLFGLLGVAVVALVIVWARQRQAG